MARPTKYSAKRRDAIVAAVAVGCTREQAALAAGIGERTLYEWLKDKPQLAQALEKAEAAGVLSRLARIQTAAKGGAWQADAWWLERKFPEQWGRRDKVQVEHSGQLSVEVSAARSVVLSALAPFPAARLAVADALEQLDAAHSEEEGASRNGHGR